MTLRVLKVAVSSATARDRGEAEIADREIADGEIVYLIERFSLLRAGFEVRTERTKTAQNALASANEAFNAQDYVSESSDLQGTIKALRLPPLLSEL